jgi:uncharacterized protein YraI
LPLENQVDPSPTATVEPSPTATTEPSPTATTEPSPTATAEPSPTATTEPSPTATTAPTPTTPPTPTPAPITYATVTGTGGDGLRCRTQPNTSSNIISVLPEGTRVETRGAESGGWIPVRCSGQDGWIYGGYANVSAPTTPSPTPGGTPGTATVTGTGGGGLNCRTGAGTNYPVITILPEGSRVETRGAASNGWVPVRCGGQDAWVSSSYVTVSGGSTSNPTPAPTPSGSTGAIQVANTGGDGLRCRTQPNTSSNTITVLGEGSRVETRGAETNGWIPVRCGGMDGWVYAAYTAPASGTSPTPAPNPTNPPVSGGSGWAMVSGTGGGGVNCRTGAGTNYPVITILPEGARVETRGNVVNGWAPVRCLGQDAWVSASYLILNVGGGGGGSGAVWIDVNLSSQYMMVYRGSTVIGQTYVSTGRYGFDTPPGTFYVNTKLTSQTMSGVLGGEYYYVPNVPWVMYFTNVGHAIHGAYWHNNFGARMSHGCINLPVGFAEWLYGISPIGTRVYIHY